MKRDPSNNERRPLEAASAYGVLGISPEELVGFENSPEQMALTALFERLENGTATEEERIEHEIRLEQISSFPSDQMTSYHISGPKTNN